MYNLSPDICPDIEVTRVAKEWMSKAETLKVLNVSERQLNRRVGEGMVTKRVLPLAPMQKAPAVEYLRADVAALRAGKPNIHAVPVAGVPQDAPEGVGMTPTVNRAPRAAGSAAAFLEQFVAALAAGMATRADVLAPWLTLEQAADYAGLPVGWLRRACEHGDVACINVGTDTRRVWRLHRDSLGGNLAEQTFAARARSARG